LFAVTKDPNDVKPVVEEKENEEIKPELETLVEAMATMKLKEKEPSKENKEINSEGEVGEITSHQPETSITEELRPEIKKPITVDLKIKTKDSTKSIRGLVDSGASGNFVTRTLIENLGLSDKIRAAPPLQVVDARGTTSYSSEAIALPTVVDLVRTKLAIVIDCYVVDTLKRDLYLGAPFILAYEDHFSFKELDETNKQQGINEEHNHADCQMVDAYRFQRDLQSSETYGIIKLESEPAMSVELSTVEAQTPMPGLENVKERLLKDYHDTVTNDPPTELPPERNHTHAIELLADTPPVNKHQYRLTWSEKEELNKQVKELLTQGFIRESSSPFNAPILFVKKKDGTLRMCMDYRSLNNFTVKNRFPLPLIDDILDSIGSAKVFSKLDLMSGYFQIRMNESDITKTAFSTPYNHYEWTVMPFGLTNAPATFQHMMNSVLKDYIGKFALVYLDDILIFSDGIESHEQHLRLVLSKLREAHLIAKSSKCEFFFSRVNFLGYTVGIDGIGTDPSKIDTVKNWITPKTAKECSSFLGLTGFYRRFVKDYSKIATPHRC
jgi:hypothetical protein